jgi:peptidoglycan/LPS O-acetylase OafA/YrhL
MGMSAAAGEMPGSDRAIHTQFGLINLLKAGAAQLIVLHHLAFYGPMADYARPVMPALIDWLDTYARIAVQVFLVIGGFLVAKSLSPQGRPGLANPLGTVWRRYAKLAPPFLVAMLLAIGASAWANTWMTHDSISAPPDMLQLGAHALLLHGVMGYESLSAGAWYVAIDFQLYAAMILLLWLSGHLAGNRLLPWLMPVVIVVGVSTSLLHFNRDADWDVWAPYFFGSYGLGIMAWWASDPSRRPGAVALLLAMMLLPTLAALVLDFRSRIAVAVAVACVLVLFGRISPTSYSRRGLPLLDGLGRISYSVFLVHFPVCLMVNAAFTRFIPAQPYLQAVGMLVAWAASLAAGAAFFRWVEVPLGRVLTFAAGPVLIRSLPVNAVRLGK